MKLLIFLCSILASEAAKLPQYGTQAYVNQDTSIRSNFPQSDQHSLTAGISRNPALGNVQIPSDFTSIGTGRGSTFASGGARQESFFSSPGTAQQQAALGIGTSRQDRTQLTSAGKCPRGQVRHVTGQCVTPQISRKYFIFTEPEKEARDIPTDVDIPLPKVEYNVLFIQRQEKGARSEPIVIPPAQKKQIIYVLNKEEEVGRKHVIHAPEPEALDPEVYFVNYREGETPTLPDGTDFNTALSLAVQGQSHVIDDSSEHVASHEPDDFSDFQSGFDLDLDVDIRFAEPSDSDFVDAIHSDNDAASQNSHHEFLSNSRNNERTGGTLGTSFRNSQLSSRNSSPKYHSDS